LIIKNQRIQLPHPLHDNITSASSTSSSTTKVALSTVEGQKEAQGIAPAEVKRLRKQPRRGNSPHLRTRPYTIEDGDEDTNARTQQSYRINNIHSTHSSTSTTSRPRPGEPELIRRVHAIISVPVKEEEADGFSSNALDVESAEFLDSGPSGTPSPSASMPSTSRSQTRVQALSSPPQVRAEQSSTDASRTKSGRIVKPAPNRLRRDGGTYAVDLHHLVDDEGGDEGFRGGLADDGDSDHDEDYDEHVRIRNRKKRRRESEPQARRKSRVIDDDDDGDELMIGAEVRVLRLR
jgi:hypothetical protein